MLQGLRFGPGRTKPRVAVFSVRLVPSAASQASLQHRASVAVACASPPAPAPVPRVPRLPLCPLQPWWRQLALALPQGAPPPFLRTGVSLAVLGFGKQETTLPIAIAWA